MMNFRYVSIVLCGFVASAVLAAPVVTNWPVAGGDDTVSVAGAALSGWYAVADSFENNVEIRKIDSSSLLRSISGAEIEALLPWFRLSGGQDGPCGLAWSDSGRSLFILVYDDTSPGPGEPSDAVIRYDTFRDELTVFARLELFGHGGIWPHLSAVHYEGHLYVGTFGHGIQVYRAQRNDAVGTLVDDLALPTGLSVRGLAVDRGNAEDRAARYLYAASERTVYRAELGVAPLVFTEVGTFTEIHGIAYSDHYGGPGQEGLYVRDASFQVHHVPVAQARGEERFAPTVYTTGGAHDIAATADGKLLSGAGENALLIQDNTDPRLSYSDWISDEIAAVVSFAKSLISPDGEPAGWVIDGDVDKSYGSRFHPASPDGAAWVVLALILSDRLSNDPESQPLVHSILERYAGLAADGIVPERSADGIYRHWIDPWSGANDIAWPPEFATLSTMLIAAAAARAKVFYPENAAIQAAGDAIICQIDPWDDYLQDAPDCGLYLKGLLAGGPEEGSLSRPFNEGILFVEQAATFGGAKAKACFDAWLERSNWPDAEFVTGERISGDVEGQFLPAFVSHYPFLLQGTFRRSSAWQEQIENLLESSGAWTDDSAPLYFTVQSAGTTKPIWGVGGFHADNLLDHPGDITTFPALIAFASSGDSAPAVAGYHAYRHGARQTFLGAQERMPSILYRRSNEDPEYTPNSAGIPDVVYGAIGLASLLDATMVDEVFTAGYPLDGCGVCGGDNSTCGIFFDGFESGNTSSWTESQ